jgi:hypothetical protein
MRACVDEVCRGTRPVRIEYPRPTCNSARMDRNSTTSPCRRHSAHEGAHQKTCRNHPALPCNDRRSRLAARVVDPERRRNGDGVHIPAWLTEMRRGSYRRGAHTSSSAGPERQAARPGIAPANSNRVRGRATATSVPRRRTRAAPQALRRRKRLNPPLVEAFPQLAGEDRGVSNLGASSRYLRADASRAVGSPRPGGALCRARGPD